jgi:hypothetical protein
VVGVDAAAGANEDGTELGLASGEDALADGAWVPAIPVDEGFGLLLEFGPPIQ